MAGIKPTPHSLPLSEQKKAASQARRMQLYGQIQELHQQTYRQYQIAHQLGIDGLGRI
jgi:hypothetical protein